MSQNNTTTTKRETLLAILWFISCVFYTSAEKHEENYNEYRYTFDKDIKKSWIKAFESCQTDKSQLLYIDTMAELNFIKQYLNNSTLRNIETTAFWTSGSDIFQERHHIWMSSAKPIMEALWGRGEPNNQLGGEHCVNLRRGWWDTFYLNNAVCSVEKYFICKRSVVECKNSLPMEDPEKLTNKQSEQQLLKPNRNMYSDTFQHYFSILYTVFIVIATAAVVVIAVICVKWEIRMIMTASRTHTVNNYVGRPRLQGEQNGIGQLL